MPEYKTTAQLGNDIDTKVNTNGLNDITGAEANEVLQNLRYNLKAKHIEWPVDTGTVTNGDIGKLMMLKADGLAAVYQCDVPDPNEDANYTPLGVLLELVAGGVGLISRDHIIELQLADDSDPVASLLNDGGSNKIRPASGGKCRNNGAGLSLGIALSLGDPGDTIKVLLEIKY